jgi:hypothetical protein
VSNYAPRVLYVSVAVEPPWTRSDKNLVRLVASNLTRYQARVLTHEGAVAVDDNVQTRPAWGRRSEFEPSFFKRISLINRVLADTDAQLIHLFWPADLVIASIVRGACSIHGLPMVHTLVRAPRTTVAIKRTTAGQPVVCLSQATLQRVQREGTVTAVYIPPGVRSMPALTAAKKASIRERYGLPHNQPICIYAGDYQHSNAARTVAATVPRVLREIECHFVLACRLRDQEDREEEARLKEAVTADGFAHRVSFVGEVKNLRELLAIADVQLFPADSHHEKMDMPMVLLEGMAEGLATVVADKKPLDELVDAGAAVGVPAMQPVALAVAIVELLRDDERRAEVGAAARSLIKERFSIAAVTEAYQALYDDALDVSKRPSA